MLLILLLRPDACHRCPRCTYLDALETHLSLWGPGAGTLFTERGTIVTVFIICYALTSFVAGYVRLSTSILCHPMQLCHHLACGIQRWVLLELQAGV